MGVSLMMAYTIQSATLTVGRDLLDDSFADELLQMVLWRTPLPSMLTLMATSNDYRRIGKTHLHERLFRLIRPFIDDVTALLANMSLSHTVISGSAALWYMMPPSDDSWFPKDLDLYTTVRGYNTIKGYILGKGFHEMSHTGNAQNLQPDYPTTSGIKSVTVLRKGDITIDIIVSLRVSPLVPIFHFHSTTVMNFISAQGFFSAYPTITEKYRGIASPMAYWPANEPGDKIVKCLEKYADRGFDVRKDPSDWPGELEHFCRRSFDCPETLRSTVDGGCLFYPFPHSFNKQCFLEGIRVHRAIKERFNVAWHLGGSEGGMKPFVASVGAGMVA